MSAFVVTGTGTGVGKTVAAAAVAAVAISRGVRVAVVKPAQTGVGPDEPGDMAEVVRLVPDVSTRELARYPEPLAPATAARRAGRAGVGMDEIAATVAELRQEHDLVLVEGAGGLLVRLNDTATVADIAVPLGLPLLVTARAGLGTLNETALTTEALRSRGLTCAGLVVGAWPREPGLAEWCNLSELPEVAGAPLLGVLPEGIAGHSPREFATVSRAALDAGWDLAFGA
ncbi:dethiobiotin synthetase [Haloactinospora alba]|uniref:ATP-dependent dethiobiotin synthetase BioD n=1 Tax=Haloactinospora alba TaxID=405555 RepID=A0A543NGN6_9ACTN|nr:dethiobiotin synthase [Haloactinospora alba]TQN30972.1 dethiobiotin synthetase [Haloactinospora alba]